MTYPAIARAMVAVAQKAPQIGKADRNQFAKYNYVSIDRYYEVVAKLAVSEGLLWQPREVEHEVLPDVGKDGAIRVTYSFNVFHESGEMAEDFARFTVLHPIQGAQTAGSAASYADKLFMRTAFKVVTGEDDADASNPEDLKVRAKEEPNVKAVLKSFPDAKVREVRPKPAPGTVAPDPNPEVAAVDHIDDDGMPVLNKDTSDWETAAAILLRCAPTADNGEQLRHLWQSNLTVIERMEKGSPDLHKQVREAFNKRREALKKDH